MNTTIADLTDSTLEGLEQLPLPCGLTVMLVDRLARRYGWGPGEILALPVTLALALVMLERVPMQESGLESAGIVLV